MCSGLFVAIYSGSIIVLVHQGFGHLCFSLVFCPCPFQINVRLSWVQTVLSNLKGSLSLFWTCCFLLHFNASGKINNNNSSDEGFNNGLLPTWFLDISAEKPINICWEILATWFSRTTTKHQCFSLPCRLHIGNIFGTCSSSVWFVKNSDCPFIFLLVIPPYSWKLEL